MWYNIRMEQTRIDEISTTRLLGHFTDNGQLAVISTFRSERTESENMALLRKFKDDVRRKLGLGFTELKSRWVECDPVSGETLSTDERSLIVYGMSLEDAMSYGKEFGQSSVIFKDGERCAEVCTTGFTDYEGKTHRVGDVVRTFDVFGNPTAFNLQDAKDIFEKRKGGPASMPVKSNRPFKLAEMFEVESPSGKNFSDRERYVRLV